MKAIKILAIVLAAVIVVLVAALMFVPRAVGPTVSQSASSTPPTPTPAPAPTSTPIRSGGMGTIQGNVILGPTCPVERIPPNPACAPRPYQTTIAILQVDIAARYGQPSLLKTIRTDSSGAFSVPLPSGSYIIKAQGGLVYPLCEQQLVSVKAGKASNITIHCDTGIR